MFKKFGEFSINESHLIASDYKEKRQKAIFEVAEECAKEVIAFMQSKGHELLDYKAYDHAEYDGNKPYHGEIQMLFAGISEEYVNLYICFKYLNDGGLSWPLFWQHDTLGTKIDKDMADHKMSRRQHSFNNIEKDYESRKGYSWDSLKKDY
jgi:hypothetical protein